MMIRTIPIALAVIALGACNPEPEATTATPAAITPSPTVDQPGRPEPAVLAVEGEGLRLFDPTSGAASPIAFGQRKAEVLDIVERLRGAAQHGTNEDCGAGPVDYAIWPDGLSLVFDDDRFTGWGLDRRASGKLTTASGIGPGSTRAQLAAAHADVAVSETTLGTEFEAGGLAGVLDGPSSAAIVTDMWAGTTCVAR